ncbi:hypothetical protein ACPCAB_26895 [Streptomyces koyangensis]|uniref:hypothetical protein n=1 Tax=Streptomyces koyangensis TaxID=188770 RepID=UPI003C2D3B53
MAAPHAYAQAGTGLRLLRAAVFTAVCVVVSAAGHVFASCVALPGWTLAAAFLGVFLVTTGLAGRERSLPGIVLALAAGQIGLHALFGLAQQGAAQAASEATLVARAGELTCGHSGAISPHQAEQILTTAGLDPHSGSVHQHTGLAGLLPSLPMFLGHLLAALVAGWLLRRGDLALFRLMRLSALGRDELRVHGAPVRALRTALRLVRSLRAGLGTDGSPWTRHLAPPEPPLLRTAELQHSVSRRGPPAAEVYVLAV